MQLQRVTTIACFDANREFRDPEQGMSSPIRDFGVIRSSFARPPPPRLKMLRQDKIGVVLHMAQ